MAPKLRKAGRKRRRFASAFVATLALGSLAACGGAKEPEQIFINPPPPEMMDAGVEAVAPTPDAATTTEANPLPKPPLGDGSMFVQGDGTCWWSYNVDCPTDEMGNMAPCNPPPPTQVQCIPEAPADGDVRRLDDGTCWWEPEPVECPEGVKCNPPPPHEVQCPSDK